MGPRKVKRQSSKELKDFTNSYSPKVGFILGIAAGEIYAFVATLVLAQRDLTSLGKDPWSITFSLIITLSVAQGFIALVGGLGGTMLGGVLADRVLHLKVRNYLAGDWVAVHTALAVITPIHVIASGVPFVAFVVFFFFPAVIMMLVALFAVRRLMRRIPKTSPKGTLKPSTLRRPTIALAGIELIVLVAVVAKSFQ